MDSHSSARSITPVMIKSMRMRIFVFLLMAIILVSCNQSTPIAQTAIVTTVPTPSLPDPQVETTSVPDPQLMAKIYLDHWKAEEYPAMYSMLTQVSQDALSEEDFTARYQRVANEAALSNWDYEILSS